MGRLNNESVKLCMLKGIVPDTDKVCKHKVCHFYVNNATNPNNKLHAETQHCRLVTKLLQQVVSLK